MLKEVNSRLEPLLEVFFGSENAFDWDHIEEVAPDLLKPAYEEDYGALVLPRKKAGGEVLWYILALKEKKLGEITGLLDSFLGRTYTDFQGERNSFLPEDLLEEKLFKLTGGNVFSFRGDWNVVLEKMDLIGRTLARRPEVERYSVKPTGRVLRDFYMAIQAGDRELAEEYLRYLRDNVLLEAANIRFLKVQLLAGLRLWREIVKLPQLDSIIKVRKPASVTAAIIQAVYNTELLPLEEEKNLEKLLLHFTEQVQPRYGMLFRMRVGLKIPEVVKAFILYAASSKPQNRQLRDDLLKLTDLPAADQEFLKKVGALIPPTVRQVELDYGKMAVEILTEGDIERAYEFALKASGGIQKARVLLDCAYEMQTLDSERAFIDSVQALNKEDRKKFLTFRYNRKYWLELTGEEIDSETELLPAPADFVEWLDRLNSKGKWKRGLEHARLLGEETGVGELLSRWGGAEKLISCLNNSRQSEAEKELYMIFPHLLHFLQRDELWPRTELKEVYEDLRIILFLNTEGSEADLALYTLLCETLIEVGMDQGNYRQLLEDTFELWDKYFSPVRLDWILDFGDLLFGLPCPDSQERQNFLIKMSGRLGEFGRRIEKSQWALIELILTDAGQKERYTELHRLYGSSQTGEMKENRLAELLQDKYVAIYTLAERVGNRVKDTLHQLCPGARVEVSSDKEGTEKLKYMARNADYFIVAWLSAKHAATEYIGMHRPDYMCTKYAGGKGSASIIRALREIIED